MSEEELNINYIREKTGLVENDELIPIILEMIKESYKAGLCQSEFDNTMGLIEQNQELSKQNNILQADKEQLNSLVNSCQEEIRRLKKQLEDKEDFITKLQATKDKLDKWDRENYYQQKEFIEYMEEQIICYENHQNNNLGEYERNLYFDIYNDILEKYKEIIGGDK